MDVLFVFTSSLFFLWVLRELFFWISLWQENEFRQDRFFVSLRKIVRKPKATHVAFFAGKWFLLFLYAYVIFHDNFLFIYQYLIIGLYLLQAFLVLKDIYLNQLKKPRLNLRTNIVIVLSLITIFLLFAIPLIDRFIWLLIIDLSLFFIIEFFVLLFSFPIEIYSDWQIEKAGRKLRNHKSLLVIAVTGSTGKSLAKDYLAAVLGRKFNVIKTEGKNNTMSGVAKTILNKLEDDTEIFVAEISAYQKGEIGLLCKFIRPRIGVLTAINNHYLSLFKTLENIKKTNFELVDSLPAKGICLFTGNNKNTFSLYKQSRKTKVLYHTSHSETVNSKAANEIVGFNLKRKPKSTTIDVKINNKLIKMPIHTPNHVEQILPAIYIGNYLGMSEQEIKRAVESLK